MPNGFITGLDIGFSNKSLVFITMSFYTMCKSTVPVFLLFFAFVWGIERWVVEEGERVVLAAACMGALLHAHSRHVAATLSVWSSCITGTRCAACSAAPAGGIAPPPQPSPPFASVLLPQAQLEPGGCGGRHRGRPGAAGGGRERV